jgi:hypothetical protein
LLVAILLAAPRVVLAQPAPPSAAQPAPLSPAQVAARAKATQDLDKAREQLRAAPGPKAWLAVADALFRLGRAGEAHGAYQEAKKDWDHLGKAEQALVDARLKELAKKTGALEVRVNEAGAEVKVDGQAVGVSPLPATMRLDAGPHDVTVAKAGFTSFSGKLEVPAGGDTSVDVKLLAMAGHVTVHAGGTEPLRVVLDGVDVGPTPWEGDLPAGKHEIAGRSSMAMAPAQSVDVQGGAKTNVDLAPTSTAAHIKVTTSDGKGVLYLDGVVKGEGSFTADVPAGPHTIVATREDYKRFEKTLDLKEQQLWAETVTLEPDVAVKSIATTSAERAFEGLYGGFGLAGLFGVGGMGSELETSCDTLGAASCNTPSPSGGGAFGYVGWTWNPVGFELFGAFMTDVAHPSAHFNATLTQGAGNPLASPGRDEDFTIGRTGGLLALRVRGSTQWEKVRLTAAGGVGVSIKEMGVQRSATATDGSNGTDKFSAGGVVYTSAALSAELAAHYRVTQTIGISLGVEMLADSASMGGSTAVGPESGHALVTPSGQVAPIPTPQYHLATGPQVFLGPFVGMIFGP